MSAKKTNRFTLYAVFGVTAVPLMIAIVMYFNLWAVPDGRTNFGQLLLPPNQLQQVQLLDENEMPWSQEEAEKRWLVVYLTSNNCDKSCQEATHLLRQINIALGKEAHRVTRLLVQQTGAFNAQLQQEYPALIQLTSSATEVFKKGQGIYLVDPLGNIMMYYSKNFVGKELLKDLKKLLKNSNIG
jgi:cytochrome oxidase Cu insertion factor (SCO1/SenC/PrrC family)